MKVQGKPILKSPLRYPGGKSFLVPYVVRFLALNKLKPHIFVEPFAGGASISLALLGLNLVENIALYDSDPLIVGFWKVIFRDGIWLQEMVEREQVNLELWETLRGSKAQSDRDNAWKCLFLNRTSFSGILTQKAGPIGGKAQSSIYKIDCRFYRETLKKRLQDLWSIRDRVQEIAKTDWKDVVQQYKNAVSVDGKDDRVFYFDPPFFHKAEILYNKFFKYQDHEMLIKTLSTLDAPWLLSYDHCNEVIELFNRYDLKYKEIPVRYTSSAQQVRKEKLELVASNLSLPEEQTE